MIKSGQRGRVDLDIYFQVFDDDVQVEQDRAVVDDGGPRFEDLEQVADGLGTEIRTDEVEGQVDEPEAVASQVENAFQHLGRQRQDDAVGLDLLGVLAVDDDVRELILRAQAAQGLGLVVVKILRLLFRQDVEEVSDQGDVRHSDLDLLLLGLSRIVDKVFL